VLSKLQALSQNQGFMKYFKNTSWLFFERALRMVVGLFVGVWVARYLGPEQFGMLSYAQSLVLLFSTVATLGLDSIVVRELVRHPNKQNILLMTTFFLRLVAAILVISTLFIIVTFISNDSLTNILVFIIASATIFQSFNVIDLFFQSKVLSKYTVFANIIGLLASSVIKVVLILLNAPLIAFAWAILFDSLLLAAGYFYFYLLNNSDFYIKSIRFCFATAKSLLKDSWPLILAGLASIINMRVDQVMLGNISTYDVVGNYSAAVRIAEIWLLLPVIIGQSIFPSIISAHNKSKTLYKQRVLRTIKYMSFFAVPFALLISLGANSIINMLYGDSYNNAGLYLALYIWTGVPYVILFALSQVIIVENLTKWNLFITIIVVILNISLNLIFIPSYGGLGAICTTLVAAYISQIVTFVIIYKKSNFFTQK